MIFRFANFADAALTRRLLPAGLVAFVDPLDVGDFPTLAAGERFAAVMQDGKQPPEIVYVTVNPGDGSFTLERGQEGTVANEWPIGTQFTQTLTRDSIDYFTSGGSASWFATFNNGLVMANARIDATNIVISTGLLASATATETVQANLNGVSALLNTTRTAVATLNTAYAALSTDLTARIGVVEADFTTLNSVMVGYQIATASSISTLTANVGTNTASIAAAITAYTTADLAQATDISTLYTQVGVNSAAITANNTTLTTAYSSLASSLTTLNTSFGTNNASVTAQFLTQSGINSSVAASITTLTAFYGAGPYATSAALTTEQTARATADTALASDITTLYATTAGNTADIASETTARTTADSAEVTARMAAVATLTTNVGTNTAAISAETSARVTAVSAEASSRTSDVATLTTNLGTNVSAITAETTARTTAVSAEATTRTAAVATLTTNVGTNTAAISAETSARVTAVSAEASSRTSDVATLTTNLGTVSAAVTSESSARVSGDAANATSIGTVSTNLGTLNASVTTIATTQASLVANAAIAKWVVDVAASGGNPAQLSLYSDSQGNSDIALMAKHIYFGANTYFDDPTDTLRTLYSGSSRRVIALGAPFGTTSTLVEWQGPDSIAFASMSKANAEYYRDIVGVSGGTGVLSSSGGSTNFTTDPFNCTGSSGTAWTAIFTRTVDFVPVNAYWTFEDLSYQFHTSDAANFTGKYRWVITNSSGSETLGTEAAFTYSDVTDGVFGSPITQFGMAGLGAKTGTVVLTLEIQRTLGSNNVTSAGGTNGAGVLTSNLVVNAKTQG
jgi:hypothetical protein